MVNSVDEYSHMKESILRHLLCSIHTMNFKLQVLLLFKCYSGELKVIIKIRVHGLT